MNQQKQIGTLQERLKSQLQYQVQLQLTEIQLDQDKQQWKLRLQTQVTLLRQKLYTLTQKIVMVLFQDHQLKYQLQIRRYIMTAQTILPANSATAATGYNVTNSLRFNESDDCLIKTHRCGWTRNLEGIEISVSECYCCAIELS